MAERGPGPDQPVLHPDGHRQRRRRPGRDRLRTARPELRDGLGLRQRRPRDRRGVGDDPPRRRRRDDRRRRRGGDPRGRRSAGSARCRRSRPATTTRRRRPGRSTSGRDGFVIGEGAGALILEALEHAEARGASRSPSSSATGRPPTPRTSPCRRPAASAPSGPPGGRSRRPGSSPRRSTTSTPTRRRRPRATGPSSRRSGRSSAPTPRPSPVTANKSMLGHTLGAAGAIEAIATIQAIRTGVVPPTINLDDAGRGRRGPRPDPEPGDPAGDPHGDVELVRVRRPEHRPRVHEVRAMTDEREPGEEMARPARERGRPRSERDAGDAVASGSATSRAEGPNGSLLAVLDRLTGLLERSDLTELEVEAGGHGPGPAQGERAPAPAPVARRRPAQPGSEVGGGPGAPTGRSSGRRSRRRSPGSSTPPRVPARRRTSRPAARWPSARSSASSRP